MGDAFMLHRIKTRIPKFTYTGNYQFIDDGSGNWRIKFLSSGTLTFTSLGNARKGIDVFVVAAGGGGALYNDGAGRGSSRAGGGSGRTATNKSGNIIPAKGTGYGITIGAGGARGSNSGSSGGSAQGASGGSSSAFNQSASGGAGGRAGHYYVPAAGIDQMQAYGGNGGSGGGAGFDGSITGGSNGTNGTASGGGSAYKDVAAGTGQHGTTREFAETGGTLYATGGGSNASATANTGNGGNYNRDGSSGIVVIRNHRG